MKFAFKFSFRFSPRLFLLLTLFFFVKNATCGIGDGRVILFYANAWSNNLFNTSYIICGKNKISSNHDDGQLQFFKLKELLEVVGCTVKQVFSIENLSNFDYLICFDPLLSDLTNLKKYPKNKLILFIWEPPVVKSTNYSKDLHEPFLKIYTLMDDLVDNVKYFKFFEPQPTFQYIGDSVIDFESRKLCAMFIGNKSSSHPNELYSLRASLAKFFDQNYTQDFDLYGSGWNSVQYKTFKGFVPSKIETYQFYRFCICYENMYGANGYITSQKIIYPMLAGCIPVYRGAPNINFYIPADCFIDGGQFKTPEELYSALKNISKNDWLKYQINIRRFLKTCEAFAFSWQNFVHICFKALFNSYDSSAIFDKETVDLLQRQKQWK